MTLYHIFTSGRKGARVLSRQPLIVILRPSCRLSVNFYCQLGYSDGWCGRGQGERGPRKGPFFCNRVVQCGRRCDWGSVYQPFDIVRSHSFDEWFTGIWPPGQSLRFSSVQPGTTTIQEIGFASRHTHREVKSLYAPGSFNPSEPCFFPEPDVLELKM